MDIEIKNYRCFADSKPLQVSFDLSQTISFVGPNNSGKSSILRFFYEFRPLWKWLSALPTGNGHDLTTSLSGVELPFTLHGLKDPQEVFCNANDRPLTASFRLRNQAQGVPAHIDIRLTRTNRLQVTLKDSTGATLINSGTKPQQVATAISSLDFRLLKKYFSALEHAIYIGAFRNAVNVGEGDYFDLSLGTKFINQWKDWKNGSNKSYNRAIISVTEDIKALFKLSQLEISPSSDGKHLAIVADGDSFRLDELGSGISQFIVVLGNLKISSPSVVLIDEPELNLHPSLQLQFLSIIASYAHSGAMFSTHSLGLARSASDSIYSVIRTNGISQVKPWASDAGYLELAGELSYSSLVDIGASKIFLCEGTTEVKTLQHFLRLLGKDKDVLLIPMGGASLINGKTAHELNELKRLGLPLVALIDSEKDGPAVTLARDRTDFLTNCSTLGILAHVLTRRALENYLTAPAIQKIMGPNSTSLAEFEKLENHQPAWSKRDNWRIAREMTLADLDKTDLLTFLQSL